MVDFEEQLRIMGYKFGIPPGGVGQKPKRLPTATLTRDADFYLGGNGKDGRIHLFPKGVTNPIDEKVTTRLGADGRLYLGGSGSDGLIALLPASGQFSDAFQHQRVSLDGKLGHIRLGGNGADGDLAIFPANADTTTGTNQATLHFDGEKGKLWIGNSGIDGEIVIFPSSVTNNHSNSEATILMDGETGNIKTKGDIKLQAADCAEEFEVYDDKQSETEPGTVMVLGKNGILSRSIVAYDKKVAGVVSGGGNYKPGIILDKKPSSNHKRVALALVGKVYCKADAHYSEIEVGDLLTTSYSPGYAMKATDPLKSFGAIIGKALAPLSKDRGLIPILIALQ